MESHEVHAIFHAVNEFMSKYGSVEFQKDKASMLGNMVYQKFNEHQQLLHRDEQAVKNILRILRLCFNHLEPEIKSDVHSEYTALKEELKSMQNVIRALKPKRDADANRKAPAKSRYFIYELEWKKDTVGPEHNYSQSFIVAAKTEAEARKQCTPHGRDEVDLHADFWENRKYTSCLKIGIYLQHKNAILAHNEVSF
jgi:hypothetical protein